MSVLQLFDATWSSSTLLATEDYPHEVEHTLDVR